VLETDVVTDDEAVLESVDDPVEDTVDVTLTLCDVDAELVCDVVTDDVIVVEGEVTVQSAKRAFPFSTVATAALRTSVLISQASVDAKASAPEIPHEAVPSISRAALSSSTEALRWEPCTLVVSGWNLYSCAYSTMSLLKVGSMFMHVCFSDSPAPTSSREKINGAMPLPTDRHARTEAAPHAFKADSSASFSSSHTYDSSTIMKGTPPWLQANLPN
jgi:hypothetical protein